MPKKSSRKAVNRRAKRAKRITRRVPLSARLGAAALAASFATAEIAHQPHVQVREPIPITRTVNAGEMSSFRQAQPRAQMPERVPFHQPARTEEREERIRRGREEHVHPHPATIPGRGGKPKILRPGSQKPSPKRLNAPRMSRGAPRKNIPRMRAK